MKRIAPIICMTTLIAFGAAGFAFAQPNENAQTKAPSENAQGNDNPDPAQAGADPSMAQPEGSNQPTLQTPQQVQNPESTVGLAPAEQPVNNLKPGVAGDVVPSSQETAAHNPSIFEHDKQPTLTHTFNFTDEQKQAILDTLAQEKGVALGKNVELRETMVLPPSVTLKSVPEAIAQDMPWVKPYLYVKAGSRIALVNPLGRYVAAVIE